MEYNMRDLSPCQCQSKKDKMFIKLKFVVNLESLKQIISQYSKGTFNQVWRINK